MVINEDNEDKSIWKFFWNFQNSDPTNNLLLYMLALMSDIKKKKKVFSKIAEMGAIFC